MKDENCIFCKLANGDIPTNTLFEDENFRVIMDASPAAEGHALVLPKDHFANAYEISDVAVAGAAKVAKKVAIRMKEVLKCDGVNILQNNEEAAGQTVFHYHVHVIPRFNGDKGSVRLTWEQGSYADGEAERVRDQLKF